MEGWFKVTRPFFALIKRAVSNKILNNFLFSKLLKKEDNCNRGAHFNSDIMGNRVVLLQAAISLLLLMSVKTSNGNLFSSLQFTRDALMGFFRGSERTVEMKIPVVNAENDTYKVS